jgi:hypothetical protein
MTCLSSTLVDRRLIDAMQTRTAAIQQRVIAAGRYLDVPALLREQRAGHMDGTHLEQTRHSHQQLARCLGDDRTGETWWASTPNSARDTPP